MICSPVYLIGWAPLAPMIILLKTTAVLLIIMSCEDVPGEDRKKNAYNKHVY
jgi:hypothetical protein